MAGRVSQIPLESAAEGAAAARCTQFVVEATRTATPHARISQMVYEVAYLSETLNVLGAAPDKAMPGIVY